MAQFSVKIMRSTGSVLSENQQTEDNARIMGLEGYGLEKGCVASLVVLDAATPVEALRLRAERLAVVSKGKVIARRQRNDARLALPERPESVRRRHAAD